MPVLKYTLNRHTLPCLCSDTHSTVTNYHASAQIHTQPSHTTMPLLRYTLNHHTLPCLCSDTHSTITHYHASAQIHTQPSHTTMPLLRYTLNHHTLPCLCSDMAANHLKSATDLVVSTGEYHDLGSLIKSGDDDKASVAYVSGFQSEPHKLSGATYDSAIIAGDDEHRPLRWMALESVVDNIYSVRSDIWSFGIVLWEMATCAELPYGKVDIHEVMAKIETGYRMPKPRNCPEQGWYFPNLVSM
ncbi:hypothetical protein SARC_04845 [Sphaeroforma arctica JP610]|uniref:Protein kinase domain-containing protein n=1 Tax=Sphaeroforma arctica JP610 TaxID=667725 RepID=A0A0L0G1A4_9EUKA|nr:hypothetical protein SARC_04845 [Sphaeroforma arctica JP610]KNC82880.1 hypothetical protein SARC_04845 [Sphaeroforma arctica JP610]|eukprot:XP_014156782.1 hypothetical protein SARC_04845 [Sphaeroforma arctica JP610]